MGRRAFLAGLLAALSAGCAAMDRPTTLGLWPDSRTWEQRRELSRAARQASQSRDFGRALNLLGRLAEADPRSAEAPSRMGLILAELGRPQAAAEAFRDALARDPDDVDALVGLARIEADLGRLDKALAHLDAAIEVDPGRLDAHLGRARALEALGQTDDALASYFRVLRIEPDTPEALMRVASIHLERSQPESALARLDHLVELSPDDPEARARRGQARLALGLTDGAVDDLRFASERLPGRDDLALLLAIASGQPNGPTDGAEAAGLPPLPEPARDQADLLRR
ncbi:tetratricopeptide repeat protein [Tautonia sociabilis]|nr:tetratricopeptide repeat protein [Tautonia sociabilis]